MKKGLSGKGFVLGIDQGSTNTRAAAMDSDGNILGYHRSDGCYFTVDGIEKALSLIMEAVGSVFEDAGLGISDIDIIAAGISGVDWDGSEEYVRGELGKHFGSIETIVCNDCEIAYYGGSLNPVGAVLCAGTGINAAFFAPGGGKFVMGDYFKASLQGGTGITNTAIEAVFESDLGVLPETRLTKLFLDFSGARSISGLLETYMISEGFSKEIKSLAPDIIEIADNGDGVAKGVLSTFSDGVCSCFLAAMKKMGMLELDCDIVLAGSVFMGRENGLTAMVAENLAKSAKNANVTGAGFEPVAGACILGAIKKAWGFDGQAMENMAASAGRFGLTRLSPSLKKG